MRSVALVVVLGLCALASAPASAEEPPRYALLPDDAWLYSAPDDAAARARTGGSWVRGVRVVAEHGDWIEVATIGRHEVHCEHGQDGLYAFDLRLFVKRADLATVLTRPLEVTGRGGARLRVAPGAWVKEGQLHVDGLVIHTDLPADAVGVTYQPGVYFATAAFARPILEDDDAWLKRPVTVGKTRVVPHEHAMPTIREDKRTKQGVAVTLRERCVELTATVPGKSLGHGEAGVMGGVMGGTVPDRTWPRGVALTWPDGRPAGRTRVEYLVGALTPRDDRVCAAVPVGWWKTTPESSLELCVAARDMRAPPPPPTTTTTSPSNRRDRAALTATVAAEAGGYQACYRAAIARQPELPEGKVVVHLYINQAGRVTDVRIIESGVPDAVFETCLLGRIGALEFGPGPLDQHVQPLRFAKGD